MPFVTEWFKMRAHLVTTPHLVTKIKSFGGHGDARNNVFQPGGKESWSIYTERLGHYFVVRTKSWKLNRNMQYYFSCVDLRRSSWSRPWLTCMSKFPTMTFVELCGLVKEYYRYELLSSPIVQHYKFNTRNWVPGETVVAYIATLHELVEHCNYGTSLSEMLWDRLVCGVNHDGIQKKLLAEKDGSC